MAFAAYLMTMADSERAHINFDQVEFLNLRACLEAAVNNVEDYGTKWTKITSVDPDTGNRWIYGWLHAGDTLEEKPILERQQNRKSFSQTGTVRKNQSAMESHFFAIFAPPDVTHAFVMLQQRGNSCNFSFFERTIGNHFSSNGRKVRFGRMGPFNVKKVLANSNLQKITITQKKFNKDHLNGLENFGDLTTIGKVTITVEPHSNGNLNVFKKLIDRVSRSKEEGFSLSSELDFEANQVKFAVDVNGRQMTIESDTKAVGRPAWLGEIEHDDRNDPIPESLQKYASEVYEAVMGL